MPTSTLISDPRQRPSLPWTSIFFFKQKTAYEMAGIQGDCGNYLLVSGAGDSMTRDSVRLAEMGTGTVIHQVAALEFPGAISALWDAADRGSATAVIKDLTSGRYEAYAISLSCR